MVLLLGLVLKALGAIGATILHFQRGVEINFTLALLAAGAGVIAIQKEEVLW